MKSLIRLSIKASKVHDTNANLDNLEKHLSQTLSRLSYSARCVFADKQTNIKLPLQLQICLM